MNWQHEVITHRALDSGASTDAKMVIVLCLVDVKIMDLRQPIIINIKYLYSHKSIIFYQQPRTEL